MINEFSAWQTYIDTYAKEMGKVENANTGDPVKADITGAGMPNANIGCVRVNPYDADEILICEGKPKNAVAVEFDEIKTYIALTK